jgi:hypothetical protein
MRPLGSGRTAVNDRFFIHNSLGFGVIGHLEEPNVPIDRELLLKQKEFNFKGA